MKAISVLMWVCIVLALQIVSSQAKHRQEGCNHCLPTNLDHSATTKNVGSKEGDQVSKPQQETTFRPLPTSPLSSMNLLQMNGTTPVNPIAGIVGGVIVLMCCCCCCAIIGIVGLLICLCLTVSSVAAFFAPCLAVFVKILVILGCGFLVGTALAKNNGTNVVVVNSTAPTTPTTNVGPPH
jgi:hypothetical protein